MGIADAIAGRWVKNEDMHPAMNIYGRKYWAPGAAVGDNIEGTYRGIWPTQGGGLMPRGLYWFFPSPTTKDEGQGHE